MSYSKRTAEVWVSLAIKAENAEVIHEYKDYCVIQIPIYAGNYAIGAKELVARKVDEGFVGVGTGPRIYTGQEDFKAEAEKFLDIAELWRQVAAKRWMEVSSLKSGSGDGEEVEVTDWKEVSRKWEARAKNDRAEFEAYKKSMGDGVYLTREQWEEIAENLKPNPKNGGLGYFKTSNTAE
jgi:hypothetical protein